MQTLLSCAPGLGELGADDDIANAKTVIVTRALRGLSFIALCLWLTSTQAAAAQEFRVASQNIWKGMTRFHHRSTGEASVCVDEENNCNPWCSAYASYFTGSHLASVMGTGPGLVGLQEVHHNARMSCESDQPNVLAEHLGSQWSGIFGKTMSFSGGEFGNAILHSGRTLIQFSRSYAEQDREPRAIVVALVELAKDKHLWFASTHLHHQNQPLALRQAAEAKAIMDGLVAWYSVPAILVGDFNLGRGQTTKPLAEGGGPYCPGFADCEDALLATMTGDGSFTEVTSNLTSSSMRFGSTGASEGPKIDYIFLNDPRDQLEVVNEFVVHYSALGIPLVTPIASKSHLPCTGNWCAADHKTVVANFRFR